VKYAAIANWADSTDPDDAFPVAFMCAQLEVSRSGYYGLYAANLGWGPRIRGAP
jgi:hypothetical protein